MTVTIKDIEIRNVSGFLQKFLGLMFKKNFNYALKFRCNGIHTFFMRENINVILTDKNDIYRNLKKNRVILPKKNVYYTYEFPSNTVKNINVGDTIQKNNAI